MRFNLALATFLMFACDQEPPPPAAPADCRMPSGMFGPCDPEAATPAGCGDGLTCIAGPEGRICVPISNGPTPEILACAANFGDLACDANFGICVITCDGQDSSCHGGPICDDSHGLCVWDAKNWPAPPPGDTAGDTATTTAGSMTTTG